MFKNFSWGHGIVVALGSFIIFILYMIIYFGNGMKNAELVSENYYEEELQFQNVIDAKNNADALTVKPVYTQTKAGIRVAFPQEILPDNGKVAFVMYRTDDANFDIKNEEKLNITRSIFIPAKILKPGSYTLKVKWDINKKNYQLDYSLQWK